MMNLKIENKLEMNLKIENKLEMNKLFLSRQNLKT